MKASKKIISIVLALVMVFSATSISCFAAILPNTKSVESVISNDNLATLVQNLLSQLNGAKKNITGTVLKLVFRFMNDDSLNAVIDKVRGDKNLLDLSDEQYAKILLDWLDANLPGWTSDINNNDLVKTLTSLLGVGFDLSSVDGVIKTVYDVCSKKLILSGFGDLKNLNGEALKNVKRSGGDLNVIYALFQWINDNSDLIAKFVKGGISKNGIDIGSLGDIGAIKDALGDINAIVKNLPVFLKSYLYLLIDGNAAAGDISKDPAGDWGRSAYKNYNADQLLAAALIKLINDSGDTVSQADADSALKLSFYGLLAKYGKTLYTRFAVSALNNNLKNVLKNLEAYEDTKNIFNYDYEFTDTSFDEAFNDVSETGFLGQLNNIVCITLKTMLSSEAYAAVAPKEGLNDNLNENLAKACRYVLPILANHSADLGFDFTKFTAEAVTDMELPEMAVAVLKIFFPGWFHNNYDAAIVNNSDTIAQLAVDALYFVVTNNEWVTLTNGFNVKEYESKITADNIGKLTDGQCAEILAGIASKLGAYTLDNVKDITHYELDKTASANWTWEEYCDDIVDWAIAYVKGIPAVMTKANVSCKRGVLDGYGPFYKVNIVLNELINFAFLNNVGDATFKLDTQTLIFDTLLNNLFNFDLKAIVDVFAKNNNADNILNNGSVIESTLALVDRILTALFSHTCGASASFTKAYNCTTNLSGNYDKNNGHYVGTVKETAADNHPYVENTDKRVEPSCKDGKAFYTCDKCGATKEEVLPATGAHNYVMDPTNPNNPTCTNAGIAKMVCEVCGDTDNVMMDPLGHEYEDGVCVRCGAKEGTPDVPTVTVPDNYADVDGNGKIESADARLALRLSVKLESSEIPNGSEAYEAACIAADVDGNGKIESGDARNILRLSVGLEKEELLKDKYLENMTK